MTAPSADHCGQWKISGCDNAQPHGPAEPETGLFHHWALTPCALMQCAPASDAFFPQAFDCRASCSCRYALATSRCSHPLAACTRWLLAPARCSHLLFALPHSLRSPTRCSPPLAALPPHSLLFPARCSPPHAALPCSLLSPAPCTSWTAPRSLPSTLVLFAGIPAAGMPAVGALLLFPTVWGSQPLFTDDSQLVVPSSGGVGGGKPRLRRL